MLFYITGGVGFVLCVLAIILIAVFHMKYKPKLIPFVMFALGLVLFLGSGFMHWREANLPEEDASENTSNTTAITGSVNRGFFNVDVTIPALLFQDEDMNNFDAEAYAEEGGYKKAVLNEDGSVTVTMSKGDYEELLETMVAQYDKTFNNMVEDEDTPYIKSITRSENFDEIVINVDKEAYEKTSDLTHVTAGLSGIMYQVFNGESLFVDVIVKDAAAKTIIYSAVYPDAWMTDSSSSVGLENVPGPADIPSSSGTIGSYDVEIKDASLVSDYDGNPAVVISYTWTNNSEDTISAKDALLETAFQDGAQLNTAYIGDASVYNSELSSRGLRPGTSFDVQCAFELANESSVIEFELSERLGSPDDVITKSFDPSTLG